jgi:hypothetical protein
LCVGIEREVGSQKKYLDNTFLWLLEMSSKEKKLRKINEL